MIPPVQLWLGSPDSLNQELLHYLYKLFCKQDGCGICFICNQIKNDQFHSVKRLAPDKTTYTVSYIDDMMTEVAYKRDSKDIFLYVFTQAQLLTTATANRLLKKFEEPTPGYHYILLAESKESLLPTIVSRSVVVDHRNAMHISEHSVVEALLQKNLSLSALSKIIEKEVPSEAQTRLLIESLIDRLNKQIMQNSECSFYQPRLAICLEFLHHLPMPGGSKLFWRSLFLRLVS
jgi:DNA polymerase III delta prime subunit